MSSTPNSARILRSVTGRVRKVLHVPKVLHPVAMQPAVRANMPVRVKNSYNPSAPGTLITSKLTKKGLVRRAPEPRANLAPSPHPRSPSAPRRPPPPAAARR